MNEMIHVFYEWNDTRVLTMIGGKLYEGEKFRFLKSEG